jgi:DNA-binding CsgD family transcriptional regulator
MWHTSAFNQHGLLTYTDHYLENFPPNIFDSVSIWDLGSDQMHVDRIRQDFAVSFCCRQLVPGYYSFRSPVDGSVVSCMVQYVGIESGVLCRWKCAPPVSLLTKNEQQVIRLAIADFDTKRIAQEMDLSESGVSYLWQSIRAKVQRETNIGAVLYAIDENLLDEP